MEYINWLDAIVIAVLLLSAWRGSAAGLIGSVFSVLSVLAGLAAAAGYYAPGAALLQNAAAVSAPVADSISFIIIFAVAFTAISVLGAVVNRLTRLRPLQILDRIGGALAGLVMGAAFAGALLILLTVFPVIPNIQEHHSQSYLSEPIVETTQNLYQQAQRALPFSLPDLAYYPDQLTGYLSPLQLGEEQIDFASLQGATCFVCYGAVDFLGYLPNKQGTTSPKFQCQGCRRTSDGCQTYEGHHIMYDDCPVALGNRGYRFDCGIWSNGSYHRPGGTCPTCGETGR